MLALLLAVAHGPAACGQGPVFVAHSAAGDDLHGPLLELTATSLRLGGKTGGETVTADLVSLRQDGLPLPPLPPGEHLILANGDRAPAHAARLVGERLHFFCPDIDGGKETSLPVGAVAVLWRVAPDRADSPDALRRRLAEGKRSQDVVLLRNGDNVSGTLSALDAEVVALEAERKTVRIPLAQVAAVALSTELAEVPRPRTAYHGLTLAGSGSRLSVTGAVCSDGKVLQARTVFGAAIEVPLARVLALDTLGGRAVYLSDLKPARYEFEPYLDERWPVGLGANAAGNDLLLSGSTYARGLGLHSRSRLTYSLGKGYRRFEALVGLDDRDGRMGSAHVRVLADGKPLDLGADRELTANSQPLRISVPIAGAKELTLVVDFGRRGNVQDVVNWADARLMR